MEKPANIQSDAKGLWSVFWRMFLFTPFVGVFGLSFLVFIYTMYLLPFLAIIYMVSGEYLYGAGIAVLWLVWKRFGKGVEKYYWEGWGGL